jgi:hypothetical protein
MDAAGLVQEGLLAVPLACELFPLRSVGITTGPTDFLRVAGFSLTVVG